MSRGFRHHRPPRLIRAASPWTLLVLTLGLMLAGCSRPQTENEAEKTSTETGPSGREKISPAVDDRIRLVPLDRVELRGFLGQRVAANVTARLVRIPTELLLDGFAERPLTYWAGERTGKWIDAAALAWKHSGDPELRRKMDDLVAGLVASQEPDGYLGTYLEEERWGEWDVWIHKYVLLGLLRYHEVTGDAAALTAARRAADLILETFGPGTRSILEGAAHMGMAATSILEPMVLLYRRTGDERYLEFSRYLVASWQEEQGPRIIQSLLEIGSVHRTANAKAYEMVSNLVGLCELYRTTGDPSLLEPVLIAWEDIRRNQLYIHGGGAVGEYFSEPHHFPNHVGERINENCVTVSWLQLTAQLWRLTGEARYAEALEHSLYNALLGAQRGDGGGWCYYTPLAGTKPFTETVHCCSSSGPRAVALSPALAFATDEEGVYVNLYEAGRAILATPAGRRLEIAVDGSYPGSGTVTVTLTPQEPETFDLALRVPSWTPEMRVEVNGKALETELAPLSWARVRRRWEPGDAVRVTIDPGPRLVAGRVTNEGRVAAAAGPLVLALDARDNPSAGAPATVGLSAAPGSWEPEIVPVAAAEAEWPGQFRVRARGFDAGGREQEIVLRDFATAGSRAAPFAVWLRADPSREVAEPSLFFGARGASSLGSMQADAYLTICPYCPPRLLARILTDDRPFPTLHTGSDQRQTGLTDGDPGSLTVAFPEQEGGEVWFEVEREEPQPVARIELVHGTTNIDGGWFDTRRGKPQVWAREGRGAWEGLGALDGYPETTASDPGPLRGGEVFALRLAAPRRFSAIRITGAASHGEREGEVLLQGRPVPEGWRARGPFASLGQVRAYPE